MNLWRTCLAQKRTRTSVRADRRMRMSRLPNRHGHTWHYCKVSMKCRREMPNEGNSTAAMRRWKWPSPIYSNQPKARPTTRRIWITLKKPKKTPLLLTRARRQTVMTTKMRQMPRIRSIVTLHCRTRARPRNVSRRSRTTSGQPRGPSQRCPRHWYCRLVLGPKPMSRYPRLSRGPLTSN